MARTSMWLAGLTLVTALLGSVASTRAQNFGKVDGARFLTLDWERGEYRGKPAVHGYINNRWVQAANNLQVTVEGLDASGTVISSIVDRLPGDLAPGSRSYFEVLVPATSNYRVSLSSYSWIDFDCRR
jgi:hypothetical protein